jgi:hypothetical protein
MNTLGALVREIAALFIDDGAFALAIIGVVVLASSAAVLMPSTPIVAGAVLLLGCLAVLVANVMKTAFAER